MTLVSALALGVPAYCAAQAYRPDFSLAAEPAPGVNLALSAAAIDSLNREFDDDFRALDAFGSGKRGMDRFPRGQVAKQQSWKLYGRFYLVNFQNKIGIPGDETRFTWRRTGPGIRKSRIYIAVHRQF